MTPVRNADRTAIAASSSAGERRSPDSTRAAICGPYSAAWSRNIDAWTAAASVSRITRPASPRLANVAGSVDLDHLRPGAGERRDHALEVRSRRGLGEGEQLGRDREPRPRRASAVGRGAAREDRVQHRQVGDRPGDRPGMVEPRRRRGKDALRTLHRAVRRPCSRRPRRTTPVAVIEPPVWDPIAPRAHPAWPRPPPTRSTTRRASGRAPRGCADWAADQSMRMAS